MKNMLVCVALILSVSASVLANQDAYNQTRVSPLWSQCDARWGANKLGKSSTICAVGCLMTSVASGLRSLDIKIGGVDSDPAVLNEYLIKNGGYEVNSLIWETVEPLGLVYLGKTSVPQQIREAIKQGKIVILKVNGGAHWVLTTGYSGEIYYVRDSGYVRETYGSGEVVLAAMYELAPKSQSQVAE